jgi:hypothetical protein
MCCKTILVLLFFLPVYLQAQPAYTLQYPFSVSAEAGASFHLLLSREANACRDFLLPSSVFSNSSFLSDAGNVTYRLLLLGSLDFYLTYLPVVNQHEYFGHLARAKQLDAGFTRYQIFFFPPSGGIAYYGDHLYHPLTNAERMLEIAGGIEANFIMADNISRQLLQQGRTNFHESMLLLGAGSDLVTYLLFEEETSHNDLDQYLQLLNHERDPEATIEKRDLLFPAAWSFIINPLVIIAIRNLAWDYIIMGENTTTLHLFNRTGQVRFLPYIGYALTPVGPVIHLNTYLVSKDRQFKFSVGHGLPWDIRHTEVCISAYRIHLFSENVKADLDIRGWTGEPFPLHDQRGNLISSGKIGGMLAGDLYFRLPLGSCKGRIPMALIGISFKSNGYSAGYTLSKGFGFKIGLGYYFDG